MVDFGKRERDHYIAFFSPLFLQPRNPHDDKLVLNKHSSVFPQEPEVCVCVCGVVWCVTCALWVWICERGGGGMIYYLLQVEAVRSVTDDVTKALKAVSDDLLDEKTKW